jgi:hypothetical protein
VARAKVLVALVPQLSGAARREMLARALAATRAIADRKHQVKVFAALLPQLEGDVRERTLKEGLAAARAIDDKQYQSEALFALLPHFSDMKTKEAVRSDLLVNISMVLRDTELQKRRTILRLLANQAFFDLKSFYTTQKEVACIAEAVVEVCWHWEWL